MKAKEDDDVFGTKFIHGVIFFSVAVSILAISCIILVIVCYKMGRSN